MRLGRPTRGARRGPRTHGLTLAAGIRGAAENAQLIGYINDLLGITAAVVATSMPAWGREESLRTDLFVPVAWPLSTRVIGSRGKVTMVAV